MPFTTCRPASPSPLLYIAVNEIEYCAALQARGRSENRMKRILSLLILMAGSVAFAGQAEMQKSALLFHPKRHLSDAAPTTF